ncbi:MAG TPA: metal ABC transporter permease [bacterium]|nr:metal ABC transporter permease [bacterium]
MDLAFLAQELIAPFLLCVVFTLLLSYLGLHVLAREVIFVDIALAQIAALGTAIANLFGHEPHTWQSFLWSLGFTFAGSLILAGSRSIRKTKIPQEAFIGIVYAIAAAITLLVANFLSEGVDEVREILIGSSLLLVDLKEVAVTAGIFAVLGLVQYLFRKQFLRLSFEEHHEEAHGAKAIAWDLGFYMSFGIVICTSVQRAGVLLVFSFLIVPSVFSALFARKLFSRLLICWVLGIVVSAVGLIAATQIDVSPGAPVVVSFGLVLFLGAIVRGLLNLRRADPAGDA